MAKELKLSSQSITDWCNFAHDICVEYCESNKRKIGGPEVEVEIDESCIGKIKYGKGKPKDHVWIFGGIGRGDNRLAFAKIVPNRSKETLTAVIVNNIMEGSIIFSDEWASYNELSSMGFCHFTICHKKMFSRLETNENGEEVHVHTNKIEGFWSALKKKYKYYHRTSKDLLTSYVAEAVFRQNCKALNAPVFKKLIECIKEHYAL